MKIYIDVSIQISHIVYMLYKTIIIELLTEYHIHVVVSPEEISVRPKKASRKETYEIAEDGTTGMINILKKFKK